VNEVRWAFPRASQTQGTQLNRVSGQVGELLLLRDQRNSSLALTTLMSLSDAHDYLFL
jgi:hypothetical protein